MSEKRLLFYYYKKEILKNMNVFVFSFTMVIIILLLSFCLKGQTVTAQRDKERIKLITSVEVRKGDTLWSIASRYITDEYRSINEYIYEIKTSNSLAEDNIHAGNFIIVPYYTDAQ